MIPKIIHQTAKTRELDERCTGYRRRLQALHPDWTCHLWTDDDNLAFVRKEFPDFLDIFTRLPKNIMRADVIRYLLMFRIGGLYLDTDYEMLKPFDLNHHDIVLPWESDGDHGPGRDKICNSIFASMPGHPFFKLAIDDLMASPPLDANLDVETVTGPIFVTKIYRRAASLGMKLHTTPRQLFSPPTPFSESQYRAIVEGGVSYGIHHCHGTWRDYTLFQRIKKTVGRWVRSKFQ